VYSNFFSRHHAFDAHTTTTHNPAISRFPILSIEILTVLGYLAYFFQIIFYFAQTSFI